VTDENRRKNARNETERGNECLREAQILLEAGLFVGAVSRAYYAAYHWARALLFLKGLEPRTHRGVIQLVSLHYVQAGTLSEAAAADLAHLETFRELCDYNAKATFDRSQALDEIKRARRFVEACAPLVAR
jgi:uncharacterized protein (UPF0332 family)